MQIIQPAKSFFIKCRRVWQVMKKPTKKEFQQIAKISSIGILLLGAVGFLISTFMKFFN